MKYPKLNKFDKMETPKEAIDSIISFLPKNLIYWECCYGEGYLANHLIKEGLDVIGNKDMDCLKEQPLKWDFLITNPPFSNNKDFIKRAIELKKPFALLIRLEHLGGKKAFELLKDFNFQIIIPKKRVNYITPKMKKGIKVGGSQFHSIWLTYKLNLPKQINYIEESKLDLEENK
jgi:hypothetical protein